MSSWMSQGRVSGDVLLVRVLKVSSHFTPRGGKRRYCQGGGRGSMGETQGVPRDGDPGRARSLAPH